MSEDLVIVKSNVMLSDDDLKTLHGKLVKQKETGAIVLPSRILKGE